MGVGIYQHHNRPGVKTSRKGKSIVSTFVKNEGVKKILIIRFSSIGDIVLTTPVIRCIKQQLGAEVHFLTKQQFLPVIEKNPFIDRIFTIREKVGEVIGELRKEKYDFVVDLHKNLRSWQVILSLHKPFGTFTKLNIRKFLICKCNINLLPDIHIVDRYFHAVKRLNVRNDGRGLDYFILERTDPWQKLSELPREDFVALVIGGKHATKRLPKEKLLEICRAIRKPIVILGGPEDMEVGEYLVGHITQYCQIYSSCGLLTLHESAALLKAADTVITHDTGLMHIAAAFQQDIISIWGNTIPEFGMYPYFPVDYNGKSKIIEVKGLSCRPCSKLGYPRCPKGHFNCMMENTLGF